MYKIYINEKPLILISTKEVENFKDMDNTLLAKYPGKAKFLLNYIDMMEKGTKFEQVILFDRDSKKIFRDLKAIAAPIKAAGGLVFNPANKILAIYRRGFWDLPKGHIHKGETKKDAAAREVMEETGLKKVRVGKKAGKTYHIYKDKTRHLKISYWYYMKSDQDKLTPQIEEDITEARWMYPDDLINNKTYASIKDLFDI